MKSVIIAIAALLSAASAAPTGGAGEGSYLQVTFHGAIDTGSEQTLSLSWPIDGQYHSLAEIAETYGASGNIDQLVALSMSTGYAVNNGVLASCSFTGVDNLDLFVTNKDVEEYQSESFVVGPPQTIQGGSCSLQE